MHKVIIFSLIIPHPGKKSHENQHKTVQMQTTASVKETANTKNNKKSRKYSS